MTTVSVSKTINVPASAAWEKLSSFREIEKFSPIARSVVEGEGVGAKRSCFMPDDAEITEELTVVDNDKMHLEYVIITGPFPIENYVSTVTVTSMSSDSCEVSWSSEFDVSAEAEGEIVALFDGFYNVIIDSLETLINGNN